MYKYTLFAKVHVNYNDFCIDSVLLNNVIYIYLTNRFHVSVLVFSNRSQMTSKCGKNKKVAHKVIAEGVTDVLTTV